jgi:hypothetical protein
LKLTDSRIGVPQIDVRKILRRVRRGNVASSVTVPRPHGITIVLGLLSPVIGIVAILFSLQSLQTAQKALETSQQSLKVGQRAYLSVLEVKYADAALQIHLKNSGNTPALVRAGGWWP